MATLTRTPEIQRYASLTLAQRDTVELARHVTIRSDPPKPRDIPFDLYDYQRDIAEGWDRGDNNIILKARQLGLSWLQALYKLRRAAFDGWRVGYWSLNEDYAIAQLETRVLRLLDSLPPEIRPRYRRRGTLVEFPDSGGFIRVFPATQSGGTSYTFDLVDFDEFALHQYGAANLEHVQPTVSGGGQLILNSTSNPTLGPNGAFYDIWLASQDGGEAAFEVGDLQPVFLPWDVRPGRDAAWLERQRRQFRGLGDHAFRAFYPSTWPEAFIGRSGLVFPQFDRELHVRESDPVPWEQCDYRFMGYDTGGGDPTALVAFGAYRRANDGWRIHQYGEWYERKVPTVGDITGFLEQWPGCDYVECDPREPTIQATLKSLGYPAELGNWKRGEGLAIYSEWLSDNRLTHSARCVNTIREYSGYRWREGTDPHSKERYATATPVDNHADAKDATRLVLVRAHYLLMGEQEPVTAAVDWRW